MNKLKCLIKISSFLVLILSPLLISGCAYTGTQDTTNNSSPDGYNLDDLNNYGEWVHLDNYGDAWRPYVVSDWMPFENGDWSYADGNWTWVSYEPFGWIVYHYGYWYDDSFYGWVWIPSDNPWSPARVNWISYDNYIGWAPLPPPGVVYASPWENHRDRYWQVVRNDDFTKDDVGNYRVENPIRNEMGGRSVVNEPPSRSSIERITGSNVNEFKIHRETVRLPKREITKMDLPPAESRRVEQNSQRVSRSVLVPRERFHAQHQEARQRSRNDNSKR
jgi:Family of unknown function (DUF6600)